MDNGKRKWKLLYYNWVYMGTPNTEPPQQYRRNMMGIYLQGLYIPIQCGFPMRDPQKSPVRIDAGLRFRVWGCWFKVVASMINSLGEAFIGIA